MWLKNNSSTLFLILIVIVVVKGNARPFGGVATVALLRPDHDKPGKAVRFLLASRGGDLSTLRENDEDDEVDLDDDSEDVDESEYDDDEEEEEKAAKSKSDKKLAASAMLALDKSQAKKRAAAKTAVSAGLAEASKKASPKKKRASRRLKLPYILRACFNPFTIFAMTKAYFGSLFNLEYIKRDQSQDLRSALEEKAKKSGGGGPKGKRKMKPGQAKTLSDLPQLNT